MEWSGVEWSGVEWSGVVWCVCGGEEEEEGGEEGGEGGREEGCGGGGVSAAVMTTSLHAATQKCSYGHSPRPCACAHGDKNTPSARRHHEELQLRRVRNSP